MFEKTLTEKSFFCFLHTYGYAYLKLKKAIIKKVIFLDLLIAFTWGFCIYPSMEILWRGYTHISMCFAGGICALFLYLLNKQLSGMYIFIKGLLGACVITAVELIFGIVFNIVFKMDVWDYSDLPFDFMGQICLGYFFLWYLLCIALIYLFEKTKYLLKQ